MGQVVKFPDDAGYGRVGRYVDSESEPGNVLWFPMIRVPTRKELPKPEASKPKASDPKAPRSS